MRLGGLWLLCGLLLLGQAASGQGKQNSIDRARLMLEREDADSRVMGCLTLGELDPVASVPLMIKLLDEDPDPSGLVQDAAASALSKAGPAAIAALPALERFVARSITKPGEGHRSAEQNALCAIAGLGAAGAPALAALATDPQSPNQSSSSSPPFRGFAIFLLERLGPRAAAATPILVAALKRESEDPAPRNAALEGLASIGPGASEAAPDLIRFIDSLQDDTFAKPAVHALRSVAPGAGSKLVAMTRHPIAEVRETALESLQPGVTPPLDPYPEGVLSATLERMSDSDYRVVWSAKLTLAAIGHQAKENGDPLWWVVPRVYWRQIMVSLLALAVWFAFWSRRFGRPPGKPFRLGPTSGVPMSEGRARALRVVFVAVPPTVLSAACVRYALSQGWATPTLPEPFLALLPLPTAGALSVSFVCVLLAIWTCRKRSHPTPELPSAGPRPETPRSGPVENNERPEEA